MVLVAGDRIAEVCQQSSGRLGLVEQIGTRLDGDRRHPATDVAADGGGVDEFTRRDDRTHADVSREMDVGHEGQVTDVICATDAFDGLGYVARERFGKPRG